MYRPPSPNELAAIDRLKGHFFAEVSSPSPIMTRNDATFLRFLRGSKHNEDSALKALLRHQEWRASEQVDDILQLRKSSIDSVFASDVCRFLADKSGRPTNYGFVKNHNSRQRNFEDYCWFIIHVMERILREGDADEQRGVMIIDLHGFGLKNMDYELARVLFSTLQSNYPEVIHRIFVVDSPMIFGACWSIIRPWIDPVTAAKIVFAHREELREHFHEEDIAFCFEPSTK